VAVPFHSENTIMGHAIVLLFLLAMAWQVHPLLAIGLAVAGLLYIINEGSK
jgi:hypothetical protein